MKKQTNYKLIELNLGQVLVEKGVDTPNDEQDNKSCIYIKVKMHNEGYFMETKMTLFFDTDEERDERFDNIESEMNMNSVYEKLSDPLKEFFSATEEEED